MHTGFLTYSTRDVATHRKVEFWDEHASDVITRLHVEPVREVAFDASLKAAQFGGIGFVEAISTPTRVVHSHTSVASHAAAAYLVHIQCRGTCINRQANTEVVLGAGDFVLCDNTLPCELVLGGENHMLVLRIPQALLKRRIPTPELYINRHMRGDRGSSFLAANFVTLFWQECQEALTQPSADRLAESVCDLLATAFMESGCASLDGSTVQTLWKLRIRRFIDMHLSDPELTPTAIASYFKISPRYVHKLYASEDEAVSRYILRRRLEACHRSLTDVNQSAKTVSTVAFDWGFNNTTHFARVFRERYGVSPSDLRRQSVASVTRTR
jgi:AraC family transcriptional activator of tynA and feaB